MNRATFTIGAETANARNVAVQLGSATTRGAAARAKAGVQAVRAYISSDAAGAVHEPNSVTLAVGARGKRLESGTGTPGTFVTNADGIVDVVVGDPTDAARTLYLAVVLPSGKVTVSPALTFVDNTP